MPKRLPINFLSPVLYYIYRGLCATLRYREEGRDVMDAMNTRQEKAVICLWHDELFPLMHTRRQLNIVTVVSPSQDGEILARVLERLGLCVARGSSTRGGVGALLKAAKLMKSGNIHGCVTVDGPKGPRHQAKDGVFLLAHRADAAIIPVRLSISPVIRVNSWDRFQVPLPFSKVVIRWGQPWKLPDGDLNDDIIADARRRLEQSLEDMETRAEGDAHG